MTTSRVGRKPVVVPNGVEVKIQDQILSAKGPKGTLSLDLHPFVQVSIDNNQIKIARSAAHTKIISGPSAKLYRSILGTIRSRIYNTVLGVSGGFQKKLSLVGVGFRAQAKGKVLSLTLGYSHPLEFKVPEGITVETPTQTEIIIKGANKEIVGLVAANIRRFRKPEPYKGKGVRYVDETVELKETKKK